ncbi:hypothetical protein NHQ30_004441 [Ciborinia camelliae]|nr:hypothetical protein NHQ30_004441 [Ciborinia camelliae]
MSSPPPSNPPDPSADHTANHIIQSTDGFVTPPHQTSQPGEIPPTPKRPSRSSLRDALPQGSRALGMASRLLVFVKPEKHCNTCACTSDQRSSLIDSLRKEINDLEDENQKLRDEIEKHKSADGEKKRKLEDEAEDSEKKQKREDGDEGH